MAIKENVLPLAQSSGSGTYIRTLSSGGESQRASFDIVKGAITADMDDAIEAEAEARESADTQLETELNGKVDKVTGKGLSTNDFTNALKTKLDGIEAGAEVNTIETVKVNGTALVPDANRAVNVPTPTVDSALSTTSENPVQNKVITGAINDLKEELIDDVETWNILGFYRHNVVNKSMSGVNFTVLSDGTYKVNGTATNTFYNNIYSSTTELPFGIEAGGKYTLYFSGTAVAIRIFTYDENAAMTDLGNKYGYTTITIPSNAVGITIRFNVAANDTANNEIVNFPRFIKTRTLQNGTDLDDVNKDGTYLITTGYTYYNSPVETGILEVNTISNAVFQEIIDFNMRTNYQRRSLNGIFGPWYKYKALENNPVKLAMFGDSITWGRNGAGSGQVSAPIPLQITRNSDNIIATNFGVGGMGWLEKGGSSYSINAYEYIQTQDLTGFDAVSYAYGLNDPNVPMGTYLDTGTDTIMGNIYNCFNYVNTNYPGMIQILIGIYNSCLHTEIGFPQWDWFRIRTGGWSDETLDAEMQKFANYYHIPYISNKQNVFTSWNMTNYLPDGVHPNQNGYIKLAGRYVKELENILG